jgi:hypothetical protein
MICTHCPILIWWSDQKNDMGGECGMYGRRGEGSACRVLVKKPEGKRLL